MKKAKFILSLLLVAVLAINCVGVTAFASEVEESSEKYTDVYDFEVESDGSGEIVLASVSSVDNTFYVYNGSHTGSSRSYSGNNLRYTITITDSNGNSTYTMLAVRLYDSSNLLNEQQFWATGVSKQSDIISISSGGSYYFQYLIASGTVQTLKIHMVIESYS